MPAQNDGSRKPSRQQLRAQSRERRDAYGWVTMLGTNDPWLANTIRAALGNRHVTRAELEEAIGMSIAPSSLSSGSSEAPPPAEPERVVVQHILISFAGAGTSATRTREAAEVLAGETLARAKSGEEFGDLVEALTDDAYPGIYRLCNAGIAPEADEHPRDRMVAAFGNVGFALEVGAIGMSEFDPRSSPFGWHIIKRLQ